MSLVRREESVLVVVDTQPGFLTERRRGGGHGGPDRVAGAAWRPRWASRWSSSRRTPTPTATTVEAVRERLPGDTPRIVKPTFGLAGCPEALEAVRATGRPVARL